MFNRNNLSLRKRRNPKRKQGGFGDAENPEIRKKKESLNNHDHCRVLLG